MVGVTAEIEIEDARWEEAQWKEQIKTRTDITGKGRSNMLAGL